MLDYIFHIAFTREDYDALSKWCRIYMAQDATCAAVLGVHCPRYLRVGMRRINWDAGEPIITPCTPPGSATES